MRKLSIVLLLIGISFMAMGANNRPTQRPKVIIWKHAQRTPISIPLEATLNEGSIEIRFIEELDEQVIFQVKDQQGNIVYQDVIVTPNEAEVYKIDLKGYKVGPYELLYIEENMTLIGEFEIERSIR